MRLTTDAVVHHHLPNRLAEVGIFADPFGDDVTRAGERLVRGIDILLGANESRRICQQ